MKWKLLHTKKGMYIGHDTVFSVYMYSCSVNACTLHNVHCLLYCTKTWTLYFVHFYLYHGKFVYMYIVQFIIRIVCSKYIYIVQYMYMYNVNCWLYSLLWAVYTCKLYNLLCLLYRVLAKCILEDNQKTVELEDDIKAILKRSWCCYKANSLTSY